MLKKDLRLTSKKNFNQAVRQGKYFCFENFYLKKSFNPNNQASSRFGIVVSKKFVRTATDRNRLKRLIREAVIRQTKNLINNFDVVIFYRTREPRKKINFQEINRLLEELFKKSNLLKKSK